jgi:hypothetical protein
MTKSPFPRSTRDDGANTARHLLDHLDRCGFVLMEIVLASSSTMKVLQHDPQKEAGGADGQ